VGAGEVSGAELKHGRRTLEARLTEHDVPLVIFVFKKSAQTLLGPLPSGFYGLVPRRRLERREELRMPADVSAGGLEDLGDLRDDVSSLVVLMCSRRSSRRSVDSAA
jgi:hypothetical protein